MARLEFAGARYVRNYHLAVPHHELVIDKKKSLNPSPSGERGRGEEAPSLEDNLILHGDNLKALKSLLPHFAGKVKCIYIDPPYNTGNEGWVYNDNVSSPRHKDWLHKVVDKECQDRHDRWLSMMMPRLKILRELMREDGVIFISIDDNEVAHLRMLMDEIFGELNFIASVAWQKRTSPDARLALGPAHDYILVYSKSIRPSEEILNRIEPSEERLLSYSNPDNDSRGDWASVDITGQTGHATAEQFYKIKTPSGKIYEPPEGRCWAMAERTFLSLAKDRRIWFGKDGGSRPRLKKFKSEMEGVTAWTWWPNKEVGHNQEATKELNEILGKADNFDNPKPTRLIERVLELGSSKNSLILDSFAGSGTTAHAVLALNKEDGGNRKFILVEQEDYADTITAERVRRVIKGVKGAKDENLKNGLGGSFTYYTLGEEYDIAKLLSGKSLPSYEDMASYAFFTATGENFDRTKIKKKEHYIGSSKEYDVYLFYEPDVEKLKSAECAVTLPWIESFSPIDKTTPQPPPTPLRSAGGGVRKRLVFGPVKYAGQEYLDKYGFEYSQLPYEIYRRMNAV